MSDALAAYRAVLASRPPVAGGEYGTDISGYLEWVDALLIASAARRVAER